MSTTSIQLPFLKSDGFMRAARQIEKAIGQHGDFAVLLVQVRDVERMCATLGYVATQHVLDGFMSRIRSIARNDDVVERVSQRKFAVLLKGLKNQGHIQLAAQKIQRVAAEAMAVHHENQTLRVRVGVVLAPDHGREPLELLRLAEVAAMDGRRLRKPVHFFESQSADELFAGWGLESKLARAIESGDLSLHFQPKQTIRSGMIVGAEVLMRWTDPEIGPISPDVFIKLAESTGQIVELTHYAIHNACRYLSEWRSLLPEGSVAINVSPSIVQSFDILDVLQSACGIWNIPPHCITLEVTENALMEDPDTSHDVLTRVREFGSRVSIDDFGTGYSSLAYLKDIPADELKIDRSFVLGMQADMSDYRIVEHIINIARSFGLSVVAEGVENADVLKLLAVLGCDFAQGYLLAKPMPASEFETYCRNYRAPQAAAVPTEFVEE